MTTICGTDCTRCKDFNRACNGCGAIQGKVYWAEYMGAEVCPLYDCCVNSKRLDHCGACPELPCYLYFDTRDPSVSVEDHERGVWERVEVLRAL